MLPLRYSSRKKKLLGVSGSAVLLKWRTGRFDRSRLLRYWGSCTRDKLVHARGSNTIPPTDATLSRVNKSLRASPQEAEKSSLPSIDAKVGETAQVK